jgi:hypothetical protein
MGLIIIIYDPFKDYLLSTYLKEHHRFLRKNSARKRGRQAMAFFGEFCSSICPICTRVRVLTKFIGYPCKSKLYFEKDIRFLPRLALLIEAILSP